MDELREEQAELDALDRDREDERREDEQAREWEAFHNDLRVRRPVREFELPMADHEQREAFSEGRSAYDPDEGLAYSELVTLETERWER